MAKKKGRTQPRKSKKKLISSLSQRLKRVFLGFFAVVACLMMVLFIYDWFFPQTGRAGQRVEKPIVKEQPKVKSKAHAPRITTDTRKSSTGQTIKKRVPTKTFVFPAQGEIPRLQVKRKEQVIRHEGYTVSYNANYRIANWVAYELTEKEVKNKRAERSNKFVPDPMVKGASATNEDYTRTGYDRGHLAPAGDMRWSAKAMRESFYFSNICPQKPGLNRGVWKELEEQSRLWAKEAGSLWVVTGPVITDGMRKLGKNQVAVPEIFYKVMCVVIDGEPQGVGFLFENRDYGKTSLRQMMLPIDQVEKVTGIDFFPSLPDSIEQRMEAQVKESCWSF